MSYWRKFDFLPAFQCFLFVEELHQVRIKPTSKANPTTPPTTPPISPVAFHLQKKWRKETKI